MKSFWDVLIVGAGPAGLSAALILGRCCRSVLVCDHGLSRSWASRAMHGFISRDGVSPVEFSRIAREELARYPNVFLHECRVEEVTMDGGAFAAKLGKTAVRARKILIATGLLDELPPIDGFEELFGISAFPCPYCDGWEYRNAPLAVYGKRRRGLEMARALTSWTRDIVLCSDGPCGLSVKERQQLAGNGVRLMEQPIARLESEAGTLRYITFKDGSRLERDAVFFDTPTHGQSKLTERLGCRFNRRGGVICDKHEATSVPGVYVAGNIIRNVQLSIVAAAEGASAAFGINSALSREDFLSRGMGERSIKHTASAA